MKREDTIVQSVFDRLSRDYPVENSQGGTESFSSVAVCGMGGSGVVGDLLLSLYPEAPVRIWKNFGLPPNLAQRTLVLSVSYSGNTAETVSSAREAREMSLPLGIVAGGGELLAFAQENRVPYCHVPFDVSLPARYSIPSLLRATISLASYFGCVPSFTAPGGDGSATETIDFGEFAGKVKSGPAFVYAPAGWEGVALFAKQCLNESSKIPASFGSIPESLHNEIESVATLPDPSIIVFTDEEADPRAQESTRKFIEWGSTKGWNILNIPIRGETRMHKMASAISDVFRLTFSISAERGVDPFVTPRISEFRLQS